MCNMFYFISGSKSSGKGPLMSIDMLGLRVKENGCIFFFSHKWGNFEPQELIPSRFPLISPIDVHKNAQLLGYKGVGTYKNNSVVEW